jgi:hypothetical protein
MLRIGPNDSVVFLQPSVENLDFAITKAGCEGCGRPLVGCQGGDRTLRIRVNILSAGSESAFDLNPRLCLLRSDFLYVRPTPEQL